MNITKREFFKRKYRNHIYGIYEDVVERAYSISEDYGYELDHLRELKGKYRTNTYIWDILTEIEYSVTTCSEQCSYTRCSEVKSTPYKVTPSAYNLLKTGIEKLSRAIGKLRGAFTFIEYIENNDLGIRSV